MHQGYSAIFGLKRVIYSIAIAIAACTFTVACSNSYIPKINGVSFVASRESLNQQHIRPVLEVKAGYAAIMPFGFIRDAQSPDIIFDSDRQWFGETKNGARQYIEMLHQNKLLIMLKPQLWISRGEFTGNMAMAGEAEWQQLEDSYERFIITYAELAEETGVEILCIGTELEQFVQQRPAYWLRLIARIRETYKGKLTYAANWDEFESTPFWNELDYIGIDAYFPLSEEKTPEVELLIDSWKPWKDKIARLAQDRKRLVLFTEFGYRSRDYAAQRPWDAGREDGNINMSAQANSLEAIFETFWREDWFAGGFVWKWFTDHGKSGGHGCNRFTPQNKPGQGVIQAYFSSFKG